MHIQDQNVVEVPDLNLDFFLVNSYTLFITDAQNIGQILVNRTVYTKPWLLFFNHIKFL